MARAAPGATGVDRRRYAALPAVFQPAPPIASPGWPARPKVAQCPRQPACKGPWP